jgi:hypothetical protein
MTTCEGDSQIDWVAKGTGRGMPSSLRRPAEGRQLMHHSIPMPPSADGGPHSLARANGLLMPPELVYQIHSLPFCLVRLP